MHEIFPYLHHLKIVAPHLVKAYLQENNKERFFTEVKMIIKKFIYEEAFIQLEHITPLQFDIYKYFVRYDLSIWRRERDFTKSVQQLLLLPEDVRSVDEAYKPEGPVKFQGISKELSLEQFSEVYHSVIQNISDACLLRDTDDFKNKCLHLLQQQIKQKQEALSRPNINTNAQLSLKNQVQKIQNIQGVLLEPLEYKKEVLEKINTEIIKAKENLKKIEKNYKL